MKEHPIIFNGEMVRAILDGRKTQTRRAIRPQPGKPPSEGAYFDAYDGGPQWNWWSKDNKLHNDGPIIKCPYGIPGDRLWVRENFGILNIDRNMLARFPLFEVEEPDVPKGSSVFDKAIACRDDKIRVEKGYELLYQADGDKGLKGWRPSIHMPRWAARTFLDVLSIRVERVQDISIQDILAEGITHEGINKIQRQEVLSYSDALRWKFRTLWDSINKKRGYGWDTNPRVFVVEV